MQFGQIIAFYSQNDTKHVNMPNGCVQIAVTER
jgi:hypothetical protein